MCSARYRKEGEAVVSRLPPSQQDRSFLAFLWNRKAGTVLGRTGTSWALIGLFYIVFYAFLAGFFSLCMFVFYQTLDLDVPKYTGVTDSLLRNPGLGFRPLRRFYDDLRPTLTYNTEYKGSYDDLVDSMEEFLKTYESTKHSDNAFGIGNVTTTCSKDNSWGYQTESPCLILKLNRMFHWTPEPFLDTSSLPIGLQHHIGNSTNSDEDPSENLWVWCESDDGVTFEQSSPGIHAKFFPYHRQEGYLSPFVVVRVLGVPVDTKVKVVCRAWARNIEHQQDKRLTGSAVVYFHREG